ncbi:MAG: hypothetical protein AAGA96_03710 [Verrucomicrobiota bacterium]
MAEWWANSLKGARANLIPGVTLWAIGVVFVVTYYMAEGARAGMDAIAELKERWGFIYSAVATGLFGGLIPFLYLWGSGRIPAGKVRSHGVFFLLFWSSRGVEVDALYRVQAWLFGDEASLSIIATKVAVDQFVYCPFWSAPLTALLYAWKDSGFSWGRTRERLRQRRFCFDVASVLLSIWVVWIPGTAIIYSLPLALQIPLFNLVLCFFVLVISVLGNSEETE